MPTFSFDETEFADQNEAASDVIASLEESPAPEVQDAEDPELADVDLRLQVADYYRAILKHEFFDTDTVAAERVDREIRTFIRERLEVLLGLRDPSEPTAAPTLFDDDEVTALKALAAKVLQRPALVQGSAAPVKKMAPPAPTPKPQVKQKAKPQPRKIPAPATAPSTKPKVKPPTAPAKPTPKPTASKPAGDAQTYISHDGKHVTLIEGETIEENGRRYTVARNEHGTLYRRDITGQVTPPNHRPIAMNERQLAQQISLESQRLAEAQLASLDETTGLAIVASLQPR